MAEVVVADLMSTDVASIPADVELALASGVMALRRVRHLPVVRGSELVGLVTHRDLLAAQARALDAKEPESPYARVADLMSTDVVTVEPSTPALDAAALLLDNRFGCLPVVNAGVLVGIVTETDFLRWAMGELARRA